MFQVPISFPRHWISIPTNSNTHFSIRFHFSLSPTPFLKKKSIRNFRTSHKRTNKPFINWIIAIFIIIIVMFSFHVPIFCSAAKWLAVERWRLVGMHFSIKYKKWLYPMMMSSNKYTLLLFALDSVWMQCSSTLVMGRGRVALVMKSNVTLTFDNSKGLDRQRCRRRRTITFII